MSEKEIQEARQARRERIARMSADEKAALIDESNGRARQRIQDRAAIFGGLVAELREELAR